MRNPLKRLLNAINSWEGPFFLGSGVASPWWCGYFHHRFHSPTLSRCEPFYCSQCQRLVDSDYRDQSGGSKGVGAWGT